jgi:Flp pilus assembly protein TadG
MRVLSRGDTADETGALSSDEGASLVEFALLVPFLILLLLGIIEFGYFLGEFNDVRHGAREGARLAAVNAGDDAFLLDGTCDAMDLTSNVTVQLTDGGTGSIGDTGTIQVVATPNSLSGAGFIEIFLPNSLQSTVEFRLEQDSDSWGDFGPSAC